MKKSRGFTLIELIIAMALTLVVMAVASTFFISTIRAFKKTEVASDLQLEAEQIQRLLVEIGTQSRGLEEVNDTSSSQKIKYDNSIFDENKKIKIQKLKLKQLDGDCILEYDETTSTLKAIKLNKDGEEINEDGYPKTLSKNVAELSIRPVDIKMNPDGNLYAAKAMEINVSLEDKKSNSKVEVPISLIVKFRNSKKGGEE